MVVELEIAKIVQGGDGIAQLDGMKVFVPFAAPGERVRATIEVKKKDYAIARIEEIIEPSPLRVEPSCPYFTVCGGCQLQHIDYKGQLVVKKLAVNETLQRVGRVFVPVRNITGDTEAWRYRNKTQYPVAGNGGFRVGFFRRNTHQLVDAESCLLHPCEFDEIRSRVLDAAKTVGETGYNEARHTGNVRHLVLRRSRPDGETLAMVVTRGERLSRGLVDALAGQPGVVGVVHNINPRPGNRVTGPKTSVVTGRGELLHTILGKRLRTSATSFFQVNDAQAEELCRKVLKQACPEPGDTVVDLYSGVGMLSLVLADSAGHVLGIEMDATAVEDARHNAQVAGTSNVTFTCGDVDAAIASINRADVVVLDPPRKGCNRQTLVRIAGIKPSRVIYVSCNPATLARDLAILEHHGFVVQAVEPVDMFPQTFHVEVVASLRRL